ncbi:MAG: hypothetical protein K6F40_02915 [Bacteroidales bacterium]|nr:hypothetical protein [Bacteroidales bacterium]
MSITTAFATAFGKKVAKNWDKIFVLVDIHDTILRACYENEETYDYFPQAREALQMLSDRPDVCLILWSGCYPDKLEAYLRRFEADGIHFDYANENPEVGNTPMACFDAKLYFNVGIDDKFGFDPATDWAEVMEAVGEWPLAND